VETPLTAAHFLGELFRFVGDVALYSLHLDALESADICSRAEQDANTMPLPGQLMHQIAAHEPGGSRDKTLHGPVVAVGTAG
jgi:hypothetical protein